MIEFNVGGILLDVPQGTKVDFKQKNILFAFDKIEAERTTSFRLPKTPTNLRAFGFSNDFHRDGQMMRVRVDAQLRMGLVVKDGYLYVNNYSYNSKDFECIFVTGELIGLQRIKELGDISQFVDSTIYTRANSGVYHANAGKNLSFARITYRTDGDTRLSANLRDLIDMVVSSSGISVDMRKVQTLLENYRIIAPKNKGVAEMPITFNRTFLNYPIIGSQDPIRLNNFAFADTEATSDLLQLVDLTAKPVVQTKNGLYYSGYVRCFRANQDLTFTFPDDLWDRVFIATPNDTGGFDFYGDYSFTKTGGNLVITGDPLAGRSVDIPYNSTFIFITPYDYVYELDSSNVLTDGWQIDTNPLSVTCKIEGKAEQPSGAMIRLKDNVPAMNVIELMKLIAALSGTILNYNGVSIVFEDVVVRGIVEMGDEIEYGTLKRTFADYAQNNYIKFDNNTLLNYQIANVNIEQEKDVLSFELYAGDNGYIDSDIDKYAILQGRGINLESIVLPKNIHIERLLSNSTTISPRFEMNIYEYNKISQMNAIKIDNSVFVWIDSSWSNGIASFTLARY